MQYKINKEDVLEMGSELELYSIFARMFQGNRKKYGKTVEEIALQAHSDIKDLFDKDVKNVLCKYIASYVSDVSRILKAGNVRIVKGIYLMPSGTEWSHHWNYDSKSKKYIDAMANNLLSGELFNIGKKANALKEVTKLV